MSDELPEEYELSEEQEEALEMIRQAIFESGETGIPEDLVVVFLLTMAAEIAIPIGIPKQEFVTGSANVYDECFREGLIEHASSMTPVDE